jgi:hypothetical protein
MKKIEQKWPKELTGPWTWGQLAIAGKKIIANRSMQSISWAPMVGGLTVRLAGVNFCDPFSRLVQCIFLWSIFMTICVSESSFLRTFFVTKFPKFLKFQIWTGQSRPFSSVFAKSVGSCWFFNPWQDTTP